VANAARNIIQNERQKERTYQKYLQRYADEQRHFLSWTEHGQFSDAEDEANFTIDDYEEAVPEEGEELEDLGTPEEEDEIEDFEEEEIEPAEEIDIDDYLGTLREHVCEVTVLKDGRYEICDRRILRKCINQSEEDNRIDPKRDRVFFEIVDSAEALRYSVIARGQFPKQTRSKVYLYSLVTLELPGYPMERIGMVCVLRADRGVDSFTLL